ncbi:hypothetical protein TRAPUB_9132 [Trametes pubescens]|uniref:Uncharacterized protein n=1 Tax=Trametes pubescens TaxID=154538 RepID=A0A1M2W3D1_TRAPU|nr:hypothetical protein TRAPUB_9132 [Trametes pubescens]
MASAPRNSEAEIDSDKLADRRAPPHIILRTLPSLSFATPTHSIRVQLSFQSPSQNKLLAMPEETVVDVLHAPEPRNSFGTPPQPYNPSTSGRTHLDILQERMATKDDLKELSRELNATIDRRGVVTNGQIVAISTAFKEFKNDTFAQFQGERKAFEEETKKALSGLALQNVNVTAQTESIKEDVSVLEKNMNKKFDKIDKKFDKIDKKFDNMDKRFDDIMAILLRIPGVDIPAERLATSASASDLSATTASGSSKRGSPVVFLHEGTPSPPDSLAHASFEPPSPSGLSPSSLKAPSLRHRISSSSFTKSIRGLRNRVSGALGTLKTAKRQIEGTIEDLDAATQMFGTEQELDDTLLQSPVEDESPVAGPSTQPETQTASKGKLRLELGQPIQRDRE